MAIELTQEICDVLDKINNYQRPIFVSGKAGTGKTTLIKYLCDAYCGNVLVCAPTGVAAVNAGGTTLHSQFNIPLMPLAGRPQKLSDKKREVIRNTKLLIIDEISMVRPDVLDYVKRRIEYAKLSREPWGGIKIVMFGDLFQLPPIITEAEKDIFYDNYVGPYFFYAKAFYNTGFDVVNLSRVFRQNEKEFIDVLNKIRVYEASKSDFALLNSRVRKQLGPDTVNICSYRNDADNINASFLAKLAATNKLYTYTAEYDGKFSASSSPVPEVLTLCKGSRVMILINDPDGAYYNGSLGTVTDLNRDSVEVVVDSTGEVVEFDPHTWEQHEYIGRGKSLTTQVCGTCTQIPLNLAWAITIHKSQGLTFDKAYLKISDVFAPGQLYVALSRCRTLEGMSINAPINSRQIYADDRLVEFEKQVKLHNGYFNIQFVQPIIK